MTDHPDNPGNVSEEQSVPPTNTQSESSEAETIRIPEPEILIPVTEAEKKEVRDEPYSPHKKSWRSYAWEFLMLFLAVFCGFLAQNYLEHRLEKEKGHQYVKSMIEDIISDSTKINQTLEFTKKQQVGLDSLSALFDNPPYSDSTIKSMYILMLKYTMNDANVALTKRTVSQLKNSGGMRLISNKISADEMIQYMEGADDIEAQGDFFKNITLNEIINLSNRVFYLKYTRGVSRKNTHDFMMKTPVKLANNNEGLLTEYSNLLFFTSGVLINYNNKLTRFKAEIPKVIEILKKENDIE